MDILKNITDRLPGLIKEANFEGANIVVYTDNEKFFKEGETKIKEIVNDIKKRIELRADQKILPSQEKVEKKIRELIPEDAELTEIMFDTHKIIEVIEAKERGSDNSNPESLYDEIQ